MVYIINNGLMEIEADSCVQEKDFVLFEKVECDGFYRRTFKFVNVRLIDTITIREESAKT